MTGFLTEDFLLSTPTAQILYHEYLDADIKSFFDLDSNGVGFGFNLNLLDTLIPLRPLSDRWLIVPATAS